MFAESWWAASFAPTSYVRTAFWGIRFVWRMPGRLAKGVQTVMALAFAHVQAFAGSPVGAFLAVSAFGLGALAVLGSCLLTLALGVELLVLLSILLGTFGLLALLVLAFVPGQARVAARLQLRVANSLGDAQLFLTSPTTAQAMVAQVVADLDWMQRKCDKIIVVAHSQGSVVAHAALTQYGAGPRPLAAFCTLGSPLTMYDADDIAVFEIPEDEEHFFPMRDGAGILLRESLQSQAYWTDAARRFATLYPGARWLNFWSQCDPVATGPFSIRPVPGIEEFEVRNTGSFLRDHTAYSKNLPQFVAPVAELILAGVSMSPDADLAIAPERLADARRAQARLFGLRARARGLAWGALTLTALWLVVSHAGRSFLSWCTDRAHQLGPHLPAWLGHVHVGHAVLAPVLAALAVGIVLGCYSAAGAIVQRRLNARVTAGRSVSLRACSMLAYGFNVVLLAIAVATAVGCLWGRPSDDIEVFVFVAFGPAAVFVIAAFTQGESIAKHQTDLETIARSQRAKVGPDGKGFFGFLPPPVAPPPGEADPE